MIFGYSGCRVDFDGCGVTVFGLPLEAYPPEAWRRYVFEQLEVAEEIGASAVVLAPEERRLLYDAVVQARQSRARSEPKASEGRSPSASDERARSPDRAARTARPPPLTSGAPPPGP